MPYITGTPKPLDDITAIDALRHPIWEWTLDDNLATDETWQRPIISTENVTDEMSNPIITLLVKGAEYVASGVFHRESRSLSALAVWMQQEWVPLPECGLPVLLIFIAVPVIEGRAHQQFVEGLCGFAMTLLTGCRRFLIQKVWAFY